MEAHSSAFRYPTGSHIEVPLPSSFPACAGTPKFGLFPFRSPLLRESHMFSFPPGTEMFHFPGSGLTALWIQAAMSRDESGRAFPIRKSPDQSVFAAPRGLSQLITSFIAC